MVAMAAVLAPQWHAIEFCDICWFVLGVTVLALLLILVVAAVVVIVAVVVQSAFRATEPAWSRSSWMSSCWLVTAQKF